MTKNKKHGRSGVKNSQCKLTEDQVKTIYDLRKSGLTLKKVAEEFNVSLSMVSLIMRGKKWLCLRLVPVESSFLIKEIALIEGILNKYSLNFGENNGASEENTE